jgi:hypothetical protein
MSAALSLTPEQLEQLASLTATKLHALLVPPPPPKRIERKVRVASAKAAEHVAKRNRRQPR